MISWPVALPGRICELQPANSNDTHALALSQIDSFLPGRHFTLDAAELHLLANLLAIWL